MVGFNPPAPSRFKKKTYMDIIWIINNNWQQNKSKKNEYSFMTIWTFLYEFINKIK